MQNIRRYRVGCGKTQSQLAREIGVEQNTVSQWELGERSPRAAILPKIAMVLRCDISDLFDDTIIHHEQSHKTDSAPFPSCFREWERKNQQ